LREDINVTERNQRFSIFDEQDGLGLLNELTERQIKGDKNQLYELKTRISFWKNESMSPEKIIAQAKDQQEKFDAMVYQAYEDHLRVCNALDFDDLITVPVKILEEHSEIRHKWQKKIRYLLVDEYQDTNQAQYQLVKLIAGPDPRFTVVGDDDQSIYAWRGAKPENLQQLQDDFPSLQVVKLEQNYRCCQRVLKAANKLIAYNPHLFEKALWSEHVIGDLLRVRELEDEEQEAEMVVSDIIAQRLTKQLKLQDFVILYRGNHQAKHFEKTLIKHRVAYQISGGTSFFSRAEIRDMMAYFRVIINPDDDAACQRIINVPRRALGAKSLQVLAKQARNKHISLYSMCRQAGQLSDLTARARQALQDFVKLIDGARAMHSFDALAFARQLGYDSWLMETSSNPKVAEIRWGNVQELCRWVEEGLADSVDNDLAQVVNQLMIRDMQKQEESQDAVQLMTLHAAKGLEFSQVYMVGMEEDLLPHRSSIEEGSIEEERRLCYVGITRARHNLTMTLAKRRKRFGETGQTKPSRFLEELPSQEMDWPDPSAVITEEEQQDKNAFYREQLASLLKN